MKRMILLASICLLAGSLLRAAEPPTYVNYQGVLRDSSGRPLSGSHNMVFGFYDDPAAGTLLVTDAHADGSRVVVSNGLFNVALGGGTLTPPAVPFVSIFAQHQTLWMQVEIDGEVLSPRVQILAAPFAQNANTLDGYDAVSFAAASHAHDASAVTSGTLGAARGGTGLAGPGDSGNVLMSNGTNWVSTGLPSAATLGAIMGASDTTLTRTGSAIPADPYKLKLNLGNANTWTASQTFGAATNFPGSGIWNASGKVGVGTSSPSWPLTVQASQAVGQFVSTGGSASVIELKNSATSPATLGAFNFNNAANTYPGQIAYLGTDDMTFRTAGGERMRINSNGNVGIGAAPTSARLRVQGGSTSYVDVADYFAGISAYGIDWGGYFRDLDGSGEAYVGTGDYGIEAYGDTAGGHFKNSFYGGEAYVARNGDGIVAASGTDPGDAGGHFYGYPSGEAYVGYGDSGIDARGQIAGGHFVDSDSSGYGYVGYSTYKIFGVGTVSFVQNHPTEKDKVIVYACPEGDEVAVYTRGTAKLAQGEAHVKLGETFKWVTNPDIGLTAHLTARGKAVPLGVTALSTTELVVRGTEDVTFDYLVYGLRIGFEESSIVQEKQAESYIPSFKDHRERYAKYPQLRSFNALERFAGMESSVRGVEPSSLDLTLADALKGAIHECDPATDPPVDKLLGSGPGKSERTSPRAMPAPPTQSEAYHPADPLTRPAPPPELAGQGSSESSNGPSVTLTPALPILPVSEAVEPGDVVVMNQAHEGYVLPCTAIADPMVVGIAAGPAGGHGTPEQNIEEASPTRVPVASFGIVSCKVDAAFGAIRRGDLLTTSSTPGYAMRAENPAPGTVVGKALEPLASGTGLIKILVMLR